MSDGVQIVRDAAHEMDKMARGVMPDTWAGHGRALIREEYDLPAETEERAIKTVEKLSEKHNRSSEAIAELVIEKMEEKGQL